jgi:tRNA (guanine-N7-)-methyltransferase
MSESTNSIIDSGRVVQHRARTEERLGALQKQLFEIFGDEKRFTWEIGCGHGHFLTAYAQAHPANLCIGVDIMSDRIGRASRKRERASLSKLHFIHADAGLFLQALPPDVRATEVFVLFPDPWPKVRHHKHRIIQTEFLDIAAAKTVANGRLYFRTDYRPYFEHAFKLVERHAGWETIEEPWPFEFTTVFQSRAAVHYSFIAKRTGHKHDTAK